MLWSTYGWTHCTLSAKGNFSRSPVPPPLRNTPSPLLLINRFFIDSARINRLYKAGVVGWRGSCSSGGGTSKGSMKLLVRMWDTTNRNRGGGEEQRSERAMLDIFKSKGVGDKLAFRLFYTLVLWSIFFEYLREHSSSVLISLSLSFVFFFSLNPVPLLQDWKREFRSQQRWTRWTKVRHRKFTETVTVYHFSHRILTSQKAKNFGVNLLGKKLNITRKVSVFRSPTQAFLRKRLSQKKI